MLPGFYHDTLGERDRAKRGRARARRSCCARSRRRPRGRTCATPTRAASRATSPTRWPRRCPRCRRADCTGRATRASMRFGGLLSEGMRLGHATGFDSGSTLDYVYRNRPTGCTPLGRLDRSQLSRMPSAGAASASAKSHIEELLRHAIADRRARGRARAHRRHRRRPRPLRARRARGRRRARPIRSCCATTASSTSSRARR